MHSKQECPLCRNPCSISSAIPNILLKSIVQTMNIRCGNNGEGCDGVVTLENLEKHEDNCPTVRLNGLLQENTRLQERITQLENHPPKTEKVSFIFILSL